MTEPRVTQASQVDLERWADPVRGHVGFRTIFGAPGTTTGDFTVGVTELDPAGWLGHHRHDPSEIYFVLAGEGSMTIDGIEHQVTSGTAVYIPGNSEHGIHNTGTEPLRFFYAFAVGSFHDIEYRFSADV